MEKIKQVPLHGKIAIAVVGILVVAGIGAAALRTGSTQPESIFGVRSVPSLTRPVAYSRDLPPEAKTNLNTLITDLRRELKENAALYDQWLTLAIRYKQAGDFAKAREVWEYLLSIHPDDVVSRHNLGDLYHHFLKDYPKAEVYYTQALDLAPTNSLDYLALHELYRYSLKTNTSAAVDILKTGIERTTENQPIDLYIALANYYADKGDKKEARSAYGQARDLAQRVGNTSLVAKLNESIAALDR